MTWVSRYVCLLLVGLLVAGGIHWSYYRAVAPSGDETREAALRWAAGQLQLEREQFRRLREVHGEYYPLFQTFVHDLERMNELGQAFNVRRLRSNQIDFLAYRAYLDQLESTREASHEAAVAFYQEVAPLLTPAQRDAFERLFFDGEDPRSFPVRTRHL